MNITVVGCGKIGISIIECLKENNDLIVVDTDSDAINEVKNNYDVMSIEGSCTDIEALKAAVPSNTDLFIAVTGNDEINMLGCFFAKKLGAKSTIARIRETTNDSNSHEFIVKNLDIDYTFNPEKLLSREIYNCISLPNSVKAQFFSSKKLEMTEFTLREGSYLNDVSLCDLHKVTKAEFVVCSVQRGDTITIPWGGFVLKSGDKIGITASHDNLSRLFKDLGLKKANRRGSVIIFGGSRTAVYLAQKIHRHGGSSTILDRDEAVCDRLATKLDGVSKIVHADGSRAETLHEYGLMDSPAFVGLTGIDEENILISLFAQNNSVPSVVSKVNSVELGKLAEQIGIENVVNPKVVVSDLIKKYVLGLKNTLDTKIETLYSLFDGEVEAVEFIVGQTFRKPGVQIIDLGLRKDINIAGIVRKNKVIIPSGKDTIEVGDSIVIVAKANQVTDLNSIFA